MLIQNPRDLALHVVSQRKKLNLSQAQLAKLVGVKQQTISRFEINPEGTKLNTLFHILSAVQLYLKTISKAEINSAKSKWKEEW